MSASDLIPFQFQTGQSRLILGDAQSRYVDS